MPEQAADKVEIEGTRNRLSEKQRFGILAYVAGEIGSRAFLVGDRFTIADAHLAWALNLCGKIAVSLPDELARYLAGINSRPAVHAALATELAAAAASA